jgi:hypothetical protein
MLEPPVGMRVGRFGPFAVNLTMGELRKHGIRLKLAVSAILNEEPVRIVTLAAQSCVAQFHFLK